MKCPSVSKQGSVTKEKPFESSVILMDQEERERLNNKLFLLLKEENSIKEQIDHIENEKYNFYYQLKRQYEEDQ